jgi:hypothetical protein
MAIYPLVFSIKKKHNFECSMIDGVKINNFENSPLVWLNKDTFLKVFELKK